MVLPGIPALFGFQLIAVFNEPFFDLDGANRIVHLAALVFVAIAIGLDHGTGVLSPAGRTYARITPLDTTFVTRDRLSDGGLMVAISLDIYLVAIMIAGDATLAVIVGGGVGCFLAWLWFAMPMLGGPRARSPRD